MGCELARSIRPRSWIAAFAFLLLLAAAECALAEEFQGKVVGVSDGDTITVLRDREPVRVRLNGIDAPESGQPFGNRAKQFASGLAFGKVVTVRVRDRDRYGRLVADVILPDARNLNHELVRAGFAWWFRRYAPNNTTLADLEAEAREARRGLWTDPKPVPPWEWRATKPVTCSRSVSSRDNSFSSNLRMTMIFGETSWGACVSQVNRLERAERSKQAPRGGNACERPRRFRFEGTPPAVSGRWEVAKASGCGPDGTRPRYGRTADRLTDWHLLEPDFVS